LHAENLAKIKPLTASDIPIYGEVIRKSFATVAKDFAWTQETAPTFMAYRANEWFASKYTNGYMPFGYECNGEIFGFVSLSDMGSGVYELNNLAILPTWRHLGYGKKLLDFCKTKVLELGGDKITLSNIKENIKLRDWYEVNGFEYIESKKFEWQPFTAEYREWKANP
jgi:ribosomal protein S18 acetylase RimI-like enzyme